ncbi:MAG: DUF4292 domain-containing protein [Flavobacterium sp.]|nr:DUF4292 domain-containing protein [Flavobacterium sp.]
MKYLLAVATIATLAFACKPVKKVQIINAAISKKDTIQTIVIKEAEKVDSSAIVRDIMSKVVKKKIDFTTFNAKIKVDYEGQETSQKVTCHLSIKKDSAIFATISVPPIGVVMKVLVTNDSVFLINTRKNTIQKRSFAYLQESTQIPFDFYTLQDVLVGNPIFITSNIVSYKATDKQLLVNMAGKVFKHLITLDNEDFKPTHSKLDDVDPLQNRTCDITFSEYAFKDGLHFATYRSISVSQKSKLDIYLDFKDYKFNEPLKYMFLVSKNYKRL